MKSYDVGCLRDEDVLAYLLDWVDGRDPITPVPPMGDDEEVTIRMPARVIRVLAKSVDDSRNLKRLVKAMIGDAVRDVIRP